MGNSLAGDERLPWLDTPPVKKPRAVARPPAGKRARTRLLLLLALFAAAAIAVIAFIAGRSTAPVETRRAPAAPVTVRLPPPTVVQPAPPPEVAQASTSAAVPVAPRADATPRPPAARRARPDRRGMIPRITRAFPEAPVARSTVSSPRAVRSARPQVGARVGIVQLGAYVTLPLAEAAWVRLLTAAPRLATLPRAVTVIEPSPGRPRYYRLRVAAPSRRAAGALCDDLHRIGRGCMVVADAN